MEDEFIMKHNASHIIQIQDEVSMQSYSPNSANSHAFGRKRKKHGSMDFEYNNIDKSNPRELNYKAPKALSTFKDYKGRYY